MIYSQTKMLLRSLAICLVWSTICNAQSLKPRVVVLTDVSTWETDDSESLVRLLVHADLLQIEGLVFTTGWSMGTTRDNFVGLIHDAVNAYEQDLPNLRRRSDQQDFDEDESRQRIGYWPSPKWLRDRVVTGSKQRGMKFIGEGNDSQGSQLIIDLVDKADDRPLWIAAWGGGNTLAQAIWRVQQERSAEELKAFLQKLRVYAITDQDRDQKTPFSDSSHQWLRREFERDLFFIWDECAWKFQNGTGKQRWQDYEMHIQHHGHLGQVYPKYKYGVEGDTPSFLHLLPIGLNDPSEPLQGGWGGYFEFGLGEDNVTRCYTNCRKPAYEISRSLSERFYQASFNEFAVRMDWAHTGTGNHNPVVMVDGDRSTEMLRRQPAVGTTLTLDATGSFDADGNQLSFHCWIHSNAGSYRQTVTVNQADTARPSISIPSDSAGKSFHVIMVVMDNGEHPLSSYRRIVVEPSER